jgi:hypothetical protein
MLSEMDLFGRRRGPVCLSSTPEAEKGTDQFIEFGSSSVKSSRSKRQRRCLITGLSLLVWSLIVIIYVADVNRSWAALEDKWRVSWPSRFNPFMLSLAVGPK